MPQPTLSDVHVDAPLTNLSLMYAQRRESFIADRVFPVVPVNHVSDKYWIFDRADFNRNLMAKRAPSAESAGGGFKMSTDSYLCDVWALHKDIDDQIRANADNAVNLDMSATRWLTNQALISREIDWAAKFFTTGIWTTGRTGVASGAVAGTSVIQWNDPASTPIQDVRAINTAMQLANGGYRGNKLVLGRQTWDVIIDHPDFVDRVKYGGSNGEPARISMAAVAALFEVDEVLIMDSVKNTGPDTAIQSSLNIGESNSFIGGKSALLVFTPDSPSLDTPGCGYTFAWNGFLGANAVGARIKSFYMLKESSTRVEIESAYAQKKVSADMGAFFATIVA